MASEKPYLPDIPAYWVREGQFMAGAYPVTWQMDRTYARIRAMLEHNITHFIDLTEPGQGQDYEAILLDEARKLEINVHYHSFPIIDFSVPSPSAMRTILDALDAAITADQAAYVHCWAGIGRTGTVVGCWLVRQGMTGDEALAEITKLRGDSRPSPETAEQHGFVRNWRE